MKRVIMVAGVVLLLGFTAGCGADNKGGPTTGKGIATTLTATPIPDVGAKK